MYSLLWIKNPIKKKPAQPSYNPQHKQKCETFVSTRLDNHWFSGDCTKYGTNSYKQKYETVVFLRVVLRLVRYNPAYNPMVLKYNPMVLKYDLLPSSWALSLLVPSLSSRSSRGVRAEQPEVIQE